ncbi:MAG: carbohydrate ABC transporter permease, partial [Arthrobacter sp.]
MSATIAGRRSAPTADVDRPGSHRQHEVLRLLPGPLLVIILVFLGALVLIPVLYIFLASVNSDIGVANGEFWPSSVTFENYSKIWTSVGLATGLTNSVLVAGSTAVVSAALSVSTAFVLVRYSFRGRLSILRGLLALQSVPGTLMVLPVFVLFSSAATYLGI